MCDTDHACTEEVSWLDVVQRNVARHLSDCISNSEDSVNLIELISLEVQLFSHARDVCIIEVGPVEIVEEVHQAAEGKDEEIKLLDQLAFTWHTVVTPKVLYEAVRHRCCSYLEDTEILRSDREVATKVECFEQRLCSLTASIAVAGWPFLYEPSKTERQGQVKVSVTFTRR